MKITSCGITDVGQKRQNNEDNFLINDEINLYVVADGMGGHNAGEVASRLAVETISQEYFKQNGNNGNIEKYFPSFLGNHYARGNNEIHQ